MAWEETENGVVDFADFDKEKGVFYGYKAEHTIFFALHASEYGQSLPRAKVEKIGYLSNVIDIVDGELPREAAIERCKIYATKRFGAEF